VVVYLDRSPEAANAVWRGALVARDRGLPLHLVALQPLHADLAEATALTEAFAAQVRDKLPLEVVPESVTGELEHEGLEAARDASLLVVAARPDPPVLRMLRRTGRPVLVVRVPARASYTRVLAAVELELDACSLIAGAHALSRDPAMTVMHVLDVPPEEAAKREREALHARHVLADLIAAAGAREDGAGPLVAFGDPRSRVLHQRTATRAELLVIGKRPRPALADALRGGVAQRVLRSAGSDTLLLPLPPRAPDERWALPDFARSRP
jgi:nucleotide-binding universal stress UspA family protein